MPDTALVAEPREAGAPAVPPTGRRRGALASVLERFPGGSAGEGPDRSVGGLPAGLDGDWRHGPAADRLLPVSAPLGSLLPDGDLRRGSTVAVEGSTSLLLALLAGPSLAGAWCAVVGLESLGALAGAERGVALDRLVLVPDPGPDWPAVVAALLDAFEVVAVRPPAGVRGSDARRLSARARERRAVLVPLGPWEGADVRLTLTGGQWEGLGAGSGHLRSRQVEVRANGRGAAARPRRARLWLPAPDGGEVAAVEPAARPAPAPVAVGAGVA